MTTTDPIVVRAKKLQKLGQALDTYHVVLEALRNPNDAGVAGYALMSTIPDDKRTRLESRIEQKIEAAPVALATSQPGQSDKTEKLQTCEQEWLREARDIGLAQPTDALVLRVIIENDDRIKDLLHLVDIPWKQVVRELDGGSSPSGGPARTDSEAAKEARAARLAKTLMGRTRVHSTSDRGYARFNLAATNNALRRTADLTHLLQVPIWYGPFGSLLDFMELILADHYAPEKIHFVDDQAQLNDFDKVAKLDLRVLLVRTDLEDMDKDLELHRVLRKAIELANSEKALLIIDHVELVADLSQGTSAEAGAQSPHATTAPPSAQTDPEVARKLRAQIAFPGEGFVVGMYHMRDGESMAEAGQAAALGHRGIMEPIGLEPLDRDETRALLHAFYYRHWADNQFAFSKSAFEEVFALGDGVLINDKHAVMPGAAIWIGEGLTEAGRRGRLTETVQCGYREVNNILKKASKDTLARNKKNVETLNAARKQLKKLKDRVEGKPVMGIFQRRPATLGPGMKVEAVHVLAELLCPENESHFEFPI